MYNTYYEYKQRHLTVILCSSPGHYHPEPIEEVSAIMVLRLVCQWVVRLREMQLIRDDLWISLYGVAMTHCWPPRIADPWDIPPHPSFRLSLAKTTRSSCIPIGFRKNCWCGNIDQLPKSSSRSSLCPPLKRLFPQQAPSVMCAQYSQANGNIVKMTLGTIFPWWWRHVVLGLTLLSLVSSILTSCS